jgi:hypothetical protein
MSSLILQYFSVFAQDRSNCSSPAFSSTTFQNFRGTFDLLGAYLCEVKLSELKSCLFFRLLALICLMRILIESVLDISFKLNLPLFSPASGHCTPISYSYFIQIIFKLIVPSFPWFSFFLFYLPCWH